MLRQMMNGKIVGTTMVSGSAADLATLAGLLEGQVMIYTKGAEGGTVELNVAHPNVFKFSVGKKYLDGSRKSASIVLPHMKITKSLEDVRTAVVGVWDASALTSEKCTYANGVGNSSRG